MSNINPYDVLLLMTITLFLLGMATFLAGILVLVLRAPGGDIKALATQTARLAQKGLSEDVVGLVGNASSLVEALNQLTKTATGVGATLALLGLALMGISCWLTIQIYQMGL